MFIILNLAEDDDLPRVHELLGGDADHILESFRNIDPDTPRLLPDMEKFAKGSKSNDIQIVALIRALLEFSGGRKEHRQHTFDQVYSVSDNARLYGSIIGIPGTNRFGHFDPEQMRNTLLGYKVFARSDIRTRDLEKWCVDLLEHLPIGFRKGHLV